MSVSVAAAGVVAPRVRRRVANPSWKRCFIFSDPGVKYLPMAWSPGPTKHRADYIFERGVWKATCRECGWQASDAARRQAALLFRAHIRLTVEEARAAHRAAPASCHAEEEP